MVPRLSSLLFLVSSLFVLSRTTWAQATNVTSLTGTWSSGSGAVKTGYGFCNPLNYTFNYPSNTGVSHSFTDDGYWEMAQYFYNSNGTKPHCIQAVIIWQHGNYELMPNNSIVMTPFGADGRIQVQDPCAAETTVITTYNQTMLMQGWWIYNDAKAGNYALQLYQFDGSKLAPMYLVARPPNMLATQPLINTTDLFKIRKPGAAAPSFGGDSKKVLVFTGAAASLGLAAAVLL